MASVGRKAPATKCRPRSRSRGLCRHSDWTKSLPGTKQLLALDVGVAKTSWAGRDDDHRLLDARTGLATGRALGAHQLGSPIGIGSDPMAPPRLLCSDVCKSGIPAL